MECFGKEENVIPFEVFFFLSPLPGYCSIWRKILIGFSSQMESATVLSGRTGCVFLFLEVSYWDIFVMLVSLIFFSMKSEFNKLF